MNNIVAAVSNAATTVTDTVTNAIYGTESNETGGTEPVSGQKGEGTATDPFDKGNDDKATTAADTKPATTDSPSTSTPAPTSTSTSTSTPSMSAPTSNPSATGPEASSRPDAGSRPGDVRPTEANANAPSTAKAGGFGTAEPSVSADPSSAPAPEAKQQGAGQPMDEPTGGQKEAVKDSKEKSEQGLEDDGTKHPANDKERQELAEQGKLPKIPDDHSGEPMKMHGAPPGEEGGAADEADKAGEAGASSEKKKVTEAQRKASVGQEGGGEHGKEKGTGEEWVKTSGFEGDGGDFDATKPGAGKEATRLMEEKGVHHDTGAATGGSDAPAAEAGADKKEKVSTMDKLKEKLHLGTGKNLEGGK